MRPHHVAPLAAVLTAWGAVALFGIVGSVDGYHIAQQEKTYSATHRRVGTSPELSTLGDGLCLVGAAVAVGAVAASVTEVDRRRG